MARWRGTSVSRERRRRSERVEDLTSLTEDVRGLGRSAKPNQKATLAEQRERTLGNATNRSQRSAVKLAQLGRLDEAKDELPAVDRESDSVGRPTTVS